ncbi:MAG TPA: hypothetical protein VGP53_02480, partial [Acidimicrobiales bacterium]|nr:hypothetical protein [Acidimicrobiales bacterium]
MADDREQLHKLALDEAERAVTQQQAVLEQVRTRAVGLIAVGSGVAAFVGVRAEQLRTAGWVSLAGGLLG